MINDLKPSLLTFAAFLWVAVAASPESASAEADPYKNLRTYRGHLFNFTVRDPHSKNYFRLEQISRGNYVNARGNARSKVFKGVRGRLAVIRSRETQDFIVRTLRPPDETWIGLRMTCSPRKLVWVTGELLDKRKHYANWGRRWHYDDRYAPCRGDGVNLQFAGIALVRERNVVRWYAIAPAHQTQSLLIEFPTDQR